MKLLLFGGRGWIGGQIIKLLNSTSYAHIEYINSSVRADDEVGVLRELKEHRPSHVLSLIGRTHGMIGDKEFTTIDYLEQEGKLEENVRDNLYGPFNIAFHCRNLGIHYTYLGTGCIFHSDYENGNEINEFDEDARPNFFGSSYSIVKGFTDRMMHLFGNVLNVRIRMPITGVPEKRNFITKIVSYERVVSISNAMTVLPELLPVMLDLIQKGHTGTINLVNPGAISHNEILEMYKEIVDPAFVWKNFSIEEQNKILASKRSNNHLDTATLAALYPHVSNIKDSIRTVLVEYASHVARQRRDYSENENGENENADKEKRGEEQEEAGGKTILVTGGKGFIASHFINRYFREYPRDNIVNIDALYYCARVENVDEEIRNSERYFFYHQNLVQGDILAEILVKHKVSHVYHFAAQSHVQNSFSDSLQFTLDNVLATHVLLEELRKYIFAGNNVEKIVHVSTDEVYGDSDILKHEESAFCPTNPYAATKASSELISKSYFYSFKMPIIITRGNNVFGPNQYPEKLIPKFISLLKQGLPVTIQGDGSNVRDFLYVDDVVSAFLKIHESGVVGETYNIGCDDNMGITVLEVAKILIRLIKGATADADAYITYIADRPYNDFRYIISNEKLKALGWSINVGFMEGLSKLI